MPVSPFPLSHWTRQTAILDMGGGKAGGKGSLALLDFKALHRN